MRLSATRFRNRRRDHAMIGSGRRIAAASSMAALLFNAAPAVAEDCRLALVLALDASASVELASEDVVEFGAASAV